jgi:arabinogalactan oligomer/maltooligosaccharide transport system permease protein
LKKALQTISTLAIPILLILASLKLFFNDSKVLSLLFALSAITIGYVYSSRGKIHLKYLAPGIILLIIFHIFPSFYSGQVAFTNDSNGHQLSKSQAIKAILEDAYIPVEGQSPVEFSSARNISTGEIFAVFQYPQGTYWIGNSHSLEKIDSTLYENLTSNRENISESKLEVLNDQEISESIEVIQAIQIHLNSELVFIPSDFDLLEAFQPALRYSEKDDQITDRISGIKYHPNNNGQMVSDTGDVLYPGWKINVGFRNFTSVINNEEIRRPLSAVLIWTFVNAVISVTLAFLMGLILALIFNFPSLKSKRIYRTIFIIPLAIPSVLSILVWAGLFQSSNGVINRIFHSSIPWLTDPSWARFAVVIVELWISFPYMFLIATGAIQSIPSEILEAASIDGASTIKSFTQIKLPLVFRTLAPLLVASLAMALNNFGIAYLLTGGGPIFPNSNGNAGATDILISYTYKLAFNANEGNNFGLASALSILNFIMVGLISIYGLRRMKTMEGIN